MRTGLRRNEFGQQYNHRGLIVHPVGPEGGRIAQHAEQLVIAGAIMKCRWFQIIREDGVSTLACSDANLAFGRFLPSKLT